MKTKLFPSIFAIVVFLIGMAALFLHERAFLSQSMYIVCGLYALLCLGFLFFQLYAFIHAHIYYNADVEAIKYRVFEVEGIELKEEYRV